MKNSLGTLKDYVGYYRGQGLNHEGERFDGIFELIEISRGSGFQIKFQARSIDTQTVFHSEVSTLSPTPSGEYSLFNLNSNTPFMCEHKLVTNEIKDNRFQLKFRFGNLEDQNSFREEIFLEAFDKTIRYQYSWGLPGGDFSERSKVILSIVEIDPITLAYNLFSEVGGSAALMELEMRLLANKVKEIEEASFAWNVSKTEDAVIKHFTKEELLTEEEGRLLTAARDVRNKFLHGEFSTAIALVEEYFKQKSRPCPECR